MLHSVDAPWQRYTTAGMGMLASAILLAASALANYRYGYSMGKSPLDGLVYGTAAAAGDVLMALSPFMFFAGLRNRAVIQTLAALVVWLVTTGFACTSLIGHASVNRLDVGSRRVVAANTYADARNDLTEARKELGFLPAHRSEAAVRAELEKHKVNRLWSQTDECQEATGKAGREYCSTYQALNAELGNAMAATKLQDRIDRLTEKSDKVSGDSSAVQSEADPQATTVAFFAHTDIRTAQGALIAMVALMILCCANFGFYLSASILQEGKPPKRKVMDLDAVDVTPIIPNPPGAPPLALAAPVAADLKPEAHKVLKTEIARPAPNSAGRAALRSIGFPDKPFPKGPLRPQDEPREAAQRFMVWLGAYRVVTDPDQPFTADQCWTLFYEFCRADHRHPQIERKFKKALVKLGKKGGVSKKIPRKKGSGKAPTLWFLKPPKYEDTKAEKAAAKGEIASEAAPVQGNPESPKAAEEAAPSTGGTGFRFAPFRAWAPSGGPGPKLN